MKKCLLAALVCALAACGQYVEVGPEDRPAPDAGSPDASCAVLYPGAGIEGLPPCGCPDGFVCAVAYLPDGGTQTTCSCR